MSSCVSSSYYKDTNPKMQALPSWPHLNLIISQRLHLQITSHWEVRASICEFGRTQFSPQQQPSAGSSVCPGSRKAFLFSGKSPCYREITPLQSRTEIAHSVGCGICDKEHLCRTWLECPTYSKTELGRGCGQHIYMLGERTYYLLVLQ